MKVLQAVHQSHVRADPPALRLRRIVSVVHAQLGILIEAVGNDQTRRSAGTLLAMHKDLLALLCPLLNNLTKVHQVLADVGIVVPRHMNVLGFFQALGLRGRRCAIGGLSREILESRCKTGCRHGGLRDGGILGRVLLGVCACRGSFEGIDYFARNVDDDVEAGRLLRAWFEVEEDIVSVDGDGTLRVPWGFLIFIIFNLMVRFDFVCGTVRNLCSDRGVLFGDGRAQLGSACWL